MNEPQSDKRKQILRLVLETCEHVFNNWDDQILKIKEVINSPAKRTE